MPVSEWKAAAKEVDAVFSARQWRRRGAAEEREEKGGSELRASATTGLTDDWEPGTEEAFAREGGTSGGRRRLPGDGGSRERRRRRRMRPTMLGVDAGETDEKRPSGNRERRHQYGSASAAPRRKQRRKKRPTSTAATASSEAGTGGLMKRETRPTATEKSYQGREDPHVVGDGKEEEGERDSGGDEVCQGSGNSITEEKGGWVCGDGREGREGDGQRWWKREEREKRQGVRRWKRGRGGRRSWG